jgi:aryl-alcohol dehydrogenase-like predicted oxidoreductase
MNDRVLGRTGFRVSEIGFGCWAISGTGYGPTSDRESMEALETAWERGVNFYDTADSYGNGRSERLLGEFLKTKPRGKIFIATKAGWDFYTGGGTRKNFSPDYLRFAWDASIKRLGTEFVDLYQLHNPSVEIIRDGRAIGVLDELKNEGKIHAIGISIHTEEEAEAAVRDGRVDSFQVAFNLLDQRMGGRVFDLARRNQIGIIVREPLAFGFLTGKYRAGHAFHKQDHRRRFRPAQIENNLRKIDRLKDVLFPGGLTLTRAALEFVLQFDEVSTVIPGAKHAAQVLENTEVAVCPMLAKDQAGRLRRMYDEEEIFRRDIL